jgi:hypothetical protein
MALILNDTSFTLINGSYFSNDGFAAAAAGIVTTNLTHLFDAGDVASYSGTGTTWTNLAGSNNLALVNSPTFVSNGAASRFVLDGTNDFMSGSGYLTGSAAKSHTVSIIGSFAALPATFIRYRFFTANGASPSYGVLQPGVGLGPGEVIISQGTTNFNAIVYNPSGQVQFISQSQTAMFTFVSSNTGIDFYLNGSLLGGTTVDTFVNANFTSPTTTFSWGSDQSGTTPISMSLAHIMFYSASLSPSEITQNYNALKDRYGI